MITKGTLWSFSVADYLVVDDNAHPVPQVGTLEGPGSKMQRDESRMPYTEMEYITLATLPSYLNGLVRNATIFLAGTERVAWMVYFHCRPLGEFC